MYLHHISNILPLAVAIILAVSISIHGWRHRSMAGAPSFVLLMASVALWTATDLLRVIGQSPGQDFVWVKIGFIAVASVPPLWLNFALRYTGFSSRTSGKTACLLSLIPLITLILVFTNSHHSMIWKNLAWLSNGRGLTAADYGIWFWVHVAYSYIVCLLGVVIFVLMYMRSPRLYRGQAIVALVAAVVPFLCNLIYLSGVTNVDTTSVGFAASGAVLAIGLFRLRVLDVVPVARDVVIDNMREGMVVLDSVGRIVDMNPFAQEVVGTDASKAIGCSALHVYAQWPDLVKLCESTGEAQTEITMGSGDSKYCYHITATPLFNHHGLLSGRLLTMRDITEAKRQREREAQLFSDLQRSYDELQELHKLKDDLTSMIVHDLRTPLTSMVMGLTAIERAGGFEEYQCNMLSMGINSGQSLLGMINDLLDISKMEAGTLSLVYEAVLPASLVESAVAQVTPLANERNQTIVCKIASDTPAVKADEDKLCRTIVNLLGNAIKFTPDGGQITISVATVEECGSILFSVSDTGEGIPGDALERIFEKFGQVETRKSGRKVSTGLGLTLCKMVVEGHCGRIWAESKLGEGSTFSFRIPIDRP